MSEAEDWEEELKAAGEAVSEELVACRHGWSCPMLYTALSRLARAVDAMADSVDDDCDCQAYSHEFRLIAETIREL